MSQRREMDGEKVHLEREQETSLITLAARAADARSPRPVLGDPWAGELMARIDYDFAALDVESWRAPVMAARARQLDRWTGAYLQDHPQATVVHLGCGLDSRVFRVDPPPTVRWFDVDYPRVVELRRKLYPQRPSYTLVGGSLAEPGWLEELPRGPAFVVAEGVTQYLSDDIVRRLLRALADHFGEGQAAFDVHSRTLVERSARSGYTVGATGASFSFGVDDPREITALDARFQLVEEVRLPALARRFHLPWRLRLALQLTQPFRIFRAMTCLLFRF